MYSKQSVCIAYIYKLRKIILLFTGRILNRFSKDMDVIDMNIPLTIRIWLQTGAIVIATLFVVCYSTPIFTSVLVPISIMYYFVQVSYLKLCTSNKS